MGNQKKYQMELLKDGFNMIELEERLEMVQLSAAAAASWCCDFSSDTKDSNVKDSAADASLSSAGGAIGQLP